MTNEFNIAVLLPTRGRTQSLTDSVTSLIARAKDPSKIQFILGFDNDDTVGLDHFENIIQPILNEHVTYEALSFTSMGYVGLNRYYNALAKNANADWLFVWNDDAVMNTQDWDDVIAQNTGEFKLLKVHTHNEHPYSIFPIVPCAWYKLFGHLSRHQMIDAELSQIAYLLNIMKIVEIDVTHAQSELTGKADETSKAKIRFEGNPSNPYDFHNASVVHQRNQDIDQIYDYLKNQNLDNDWWPQVKTGQQDPWTHLKANDPNGQMSQFKIKKDTITGQAVMVKE